MIPIRNSRMKLSQGQIFWREIGQGPVVVFLHGSWTDSSQWLSVIERLSLDHHCFAPDLLGFGDSEHPDIHYSIDLEVEYLAEYLESLRLQQVYLVGHSLGGWIAASYALRYLEQVRGLVLLSPEGVQVEGLRKRWWWTRWLIKRPTMALWLLRSLHPVTKILGLQAKIRRSLQFRRQLLESPTASELLFQRRWAEVQAELLQERLSWLKVPVLILQGTQDTPMAAAQSQTYARLAPATEVYVIEGGQDLAGALPERVAEQIRKFVSTSIPM